MPYTEAPNPSMEKKSQGLSGVAWKMLEGKKEVQEERPSDTDSIKVYLIEGR